MAGPTLSPAERSQDRSAYVKSGVPCLILALLGVVGRLHARKVKRRRLDTSHYLIILGTVFSTLRSEPCLF